MPRLPVALRVLVSLCFAVWLGWLAGCGPSARPSQSSPAGGPPPPQIGEGDLPGENGGGSPQLPEPASGGQPGFGSGAAAPAPAAGNDSDLEFCVEETNRYRRSKGRPPVTRSAALERYAAEGAVYDNRAQTPHKHFSDTNGGNLAFAENECLGFQGWSLEYAGGTTRAAVKKCLQAFFDEGPGGGHYENMLGEKYKTLGCAIYVDGGKVSIVQDFGF